MSKPLAIVLLSGGMDSCVTAAIANLDNEMAFLHVNYGQRTEERELKAFNDLSSFYTVHQSLLVDLNYLQQIGGSALTDKGIEVPVSNASSVIPSSQIPITYVPFRNAHFLSIAVSWGEVIGAGSIYIGAVEEDSSGYPDCREVFYKAFKQVIDAGTKPETSIEIIMPLIQMKKGKIVSRGMSLGAPLHLTWSCYKENKIACGKCDSCILRLNGFKEAGVTDRIIYREESAV